MASFSVALDGRFEPLGNRSFGSPEAPDVPAGNAGTPSSSVNTGGDATAVESAPETNSGSLTFKEAFGADARLVRTNDPNNMFAVKSPAPAETPDQLKAQYGDSYDAATNRVLIDGAWQSPPGTGNAVWNYDAKTQTFTSPDGQKKVSAASLGIGGASDGRAVPFLLAPLATEAGQNGDSWSNYALIHNSYGDGKQGSSSFRLAGAQDLIKASGDIISYDNKPDQGNKYAGLVLAGALAVTGFGAALVAAMPASFGVVGATAASGAIIGGTSAALTGGDVLKGAVIGGVGGAVSGYASGLEGGTNYAGQSQSGGLLTTSNLVNAAGKTGIALATGSDPVKAAASSLAGSAATNATGEQSVGLLASGATNAALTDTPDLTRNSPSETSSVAPTTSATPTTTTNTNTAATFSSTLPSEFKYVNLSRG